MELFAPCGFVTKTVSVCFKLDNFMGLIESKFHIKSTTLRVLQHFTSVGCSSFTGDLLRLRAQLITVAKSCIQIRPSFPLLCVPAYGTRLSPPFFAPQPERGETSAVIHNVSLANILGKTQHTAQVYSC